jgi:hypothetical protein
VPLRHMRSPPLTTAGAYSSTASAALGDGGGGFHLFGGLPPSLSSSSSSSSDEFSGVTGGESPYCSRSWNSSLSCSRRSRRRILLSFLHTARSCSCRCVAWAIAWVRRVGGSDRVASTVTLY